MDKVKVALAWLKAHHFWVLTVIVLGTGLGIWYTSASSLASQTESNESKIEGEFSKIEGYQRQPFKPNEEINRKQESQVNEQAEKALSEWRELYTKQKDQVIIWPEELGQDFIGAVQNAKFGDPISGSRREVYQNYINKTFPNLLQIVDAEPLEEGRSGRRGGGIGGGYGEGYSGQGQEPGESYLVQWLDQQSLRSRLDLKSEPSPLQIWVLQEDLWVYRTLLESIAAANKESGASRSERAAVQTIVELKVGQPAAGYNPTETRLAEPDQTGAPVASGGFDGGYGGEGGYGGDFAGGEGGGYGAEGYGGERGGYGGGEAAYGGGGYGVAAGGDTEGDLTAQLLANRYLNSEGEPIADASTDFSVYGREFKRLPVRMVLEMDSRWLSHLMWELATAPMQVEIEEVRFNPDGQSAKRRSNTDGQVEAFDRRPTQGTVIMHGIVYLFNEPDNSIAASAETP